MARPGQAGTGTGDGFGGSQMPKGEVESLIRESVGG